MKNFLALFLMVCFIPAVSMAAKAKTKSSIRVVEGADNVDSCGLGWDVTQKKSFIATTTRGTTAAVVPPTIGMTLGTIGCEKHEFAKNEESAVTFALANKDALALELAQGYGEYVDGFAQSMGCSNSADFGKTMQENYSTIIGTDPNAIEIYQNVKRQISQDSVLSASCGV